MQKEMPLVDLVCEAINRYWQRWYDLDTKQTQTVILVPLPFAILLKQEMNKFSPSAGGLDGSVLGMSIRGYPIAIGYAMEIVIYHTTCTLSVSENAPIVKIPLMPGASLPDAGDVYDRAMFVMRKVHFGGGEIALN